MTSIFWTLGLLLLFSNATLQVILLPHKSTFKGAELQYNRDEEAELKMHPVQVAVENAEKAAMFIAKAQEYGIDIITLPQNGLVSQMFSNYTKDATFIPDPARKIVPCNDKTNKYSKPLQILSCAAKNSRMYVVADYKEKVECPRRICRLTKLEMYHTAVVFNRKGEVSVRQRLLPLRKTSSTKLANMKYVPFIPDFNATFGEFICFDVNYKTYESWIKGTFDISDIFIVTRWYTELPFSEPSKEKGENKSWWSSSNNINIHTELTFGRQCPESLSLQKLNKAKNEIITTGFPSYQRKFMNDSRLGITVLFSENEILSINFMQLRTLYKNDLKVLASDLINQTAKEFNRTLCHDGTCCHFNIANNIQTNLKDHNADRYYRYHVGVIDGSNIFGRTNDANGTVCGILACLETNGTSCGLEFGRNVTKYLPTTIRNVNMTITTKNSQYTYISIPDLPIDFPNPLTDVRNFRFVKDMGENWRPPFLTTFEHVKGESQVSNMTYEPEPKTRATKFSTPFFCTFFFAVVMMSATVIVSFKRRRPAAKTHKKTPYTSLNAESSGILLRELNEEGKYTFPLNQQ